MEPGIQIPIVVATFVVLFLVINKIDGQKTGEKMIAKSTVKCFRKFATFEGRASKSEFWPFYLICTFSNAITFDRINLISGLGRIKIFV